MTASEVSARQKQLFFTQPGAPVEIVTLPDSAELEALAEVLHDANSAPYVAAIIVQAPVPPGLERVLDLIDPGKDIDALGTVSTRPACATADGIVWVAAPFLERGASVAVVGARGFVGSGVVSLLHGDGHNQLALDVGYDLRLVRGVDIVISTHRPCRAADRRASPREPSTRVRLRMKSHVRCLHLPPKARSRWTPLDEYH